MNKILGIQLATGFTLDVIKLCAACIMVIDHINSILLGNSHLEMALLGRAAFPLFAFAFACNLARGISYKNALTRLIVFGLMTYPIYCFAFGKWNANILLTFSCAAFLDLFLLKRSAWIAHTIFALALIWTIPLSPFIEFGTAGVILAVALAKAMRGEKIFLIYALLSLILINSNPGSLWIATVLGISSTLLIPFFILSQIPNNNEKPRFLPGRFLYYFYPAHLAILGLLKFFI